MILSIKERKFSKSDLGYLLLTLYCLAMLGFFAIGTGAMWLRSWGPAKFRSFSMPSQSMTPSLQVGDYILAALHTWQEPKPRRGDIIFHYTNQSRSVIYVKRVVGLPGDTVQYISGRLHINGQPLPRERLEDYPTTDDYGRKVSVPRYKEGFPDGTSQIIIERQGDKAYYDNTMPVTVPDGEVFVMGDNRDNSSDSRDSTLGTVPISQILGHPIVIFWSKDHSRIGTTPH